MIPNFRIAASERVTGLLFHNDVRMPRTKVLTAEQKKFRQSKLKVQNVFGVDIS